MRAVLAVAAGYAVWTALWLIGNGAVFAEGAEVLGRGEPYTVVAPLLGVLALSVVCSVAGGAATARIATGRARRHVLVLALLLLATGIAVQAVSWSLLPVWYHLTFLSLLVPCTALGGRLVSGPRRHVAAT